MQLVVESKLDFVWDVAFLMGHEIAIRLAALKTEAASYDRFIQGFSEEIL